jgi:hypothetical protein
MRRATKEYIEFFKYNERVTDILDQMFDRFNELPRSEAEYFLKLKNSLDLNEMNERVGQGIEQIFSDDELNEVVSLYRRHPSLMKVLGSQNALFEIGQQAAQDMVQRAVERVPYVMSAGEC